MHLKNVEIFCEVVTRRSFSKAAEVHHVSQSSASQAVHMLEKRLGLKLIDRSKRPFELTDAGDVYFNGCRKLLESFREIEDRVQRVRNKVTGRVRVAAIYSIGLPQMDAYAKRFESTYPDSALSLEYLHPDDVYERVRSDEVDLGLVSFPQDRGEITSIGWQNQEIVLVVSPGHRLAVQDTVSLNDLAGEEYVGFSSELRVRKEVDRWLKKAKVSVNVVHEFDNIENIKRAVEIGSGIALLPAPTVRREAESGSIVAKHLSDVHLDRPLGIIHKRSRTLSSAAVKFVELLHEDCEEPSETGDSSVSATETRMARTGQPSAGNGRRTTSTRAKG